MHYKCVYGLGLLRIADAARDSKVAFEKPILGMRGRWEESGCDIFANISRWCGIGVAPKSAL